MLIQATSDRLFSPKIQPVIALKQRSLLGQTMGDKKKQQREGVSHKRDLDKLFSNDGQVPERLRQAL